AAAWIGSVVAIGRAFVEEFLLDESEVLEDDVGRPIRVIAARRTGRVSGNRTRDGGCWDHGLGRGRPEGSGPHGRAGPARDAPILGVAMHEYLLKGLSAQASSCKRGARAPVRICENRTSY